MGRPSFPIRGSVCGEQWPLAVLWWLVARAGFEPATTPRPSFGRRGGLSALLPGKLRQGAADLRGQRRNNVTRRSSGRATRRVWARRPAPPARRAKNGGRIDLPRLFLHGEYGFTFETVASRLAEPMRRDLSQPVRGRDPLWPLDGAGHTDRGQRQPGAVACDRGAGRLAVVSACSRRGLQVGAEIGVHLVASNRCLADNRRDPPS